MATDLSADPFHESSRRLGTRRFAVLGGDFHFDSNSEALLQLADAAFAGLPPHRLPGVRPRFRVSLRRLPAASQARLPAPAALSGAGFLAAATARSNGVVLSPDARAALVLVSEELLSDPYLLRYEYLEFAVFTLASRACNLLALHAACIGRAGRGVLAVGDSGAGKSTLALHALLGGYQVLAEDAVFVETTQLLATGLSNFVHVRAASLRFVPAAMRLQLRRAPTIRRRSGVQKFELDMRQPAFRIARHALTLQAIVFLSERTAAAGRPLLSPLEAPQALRRFMRTQPYATRQRAWPRFRRRLQTVPCFELRRGAHPDAALPALAELLR